MVRFIPGGDESIEMAENYASSAGYDVEYSWKEYVTSGEAVTWCAEQNIAALDIVIPSGQTPYSRVQDNYTLVDITVKALNTIAQ
jgi:hypothetical protein